ncbi:expressed unknown protein [Seminavis robusta]|uniref:Uncharacterized protein n=1 Tax=Seminavis robusta TaxID=568900 RepID=A0A9N8EDC6_9STRA|nr:expressed unknown protein [Seminavis robusta]|eukprot:Sro1011_g231030.1 n/a (191) ;mRNA; f:17049-17621
MDMASKADGGNTPVKGKKNALEKEGASIVLSNKKQKSEEAVAMGPGESDRAPEAEPAASMSDAPAAATVLSSEEIMKMFEAQSLANEALKADMKALEAGTKALEARLDGIAGAMEPATEYALFETAIYEFVEAKHLQERKKIKYQVSRLCSWILYNLFGEQKPDPPAVPSIRSEQEVLTFLLAAMAGISA